MLAAFNNPRKIVVFAMLFSCGALACSDAFAQRQFYTSWRHGPKKVYRYSVYYHKVAADSEGFRRRLVVYYPQQPEYYFYFNPHEDQYWGRVLRESSAFSVLSPDRRKLRLRDIADGDFAAPGPTPVIPDSSDGVRMWLPSTPGAMRSAVVGASAVKLPLAETLPRSLQAQAQAQAKSDRLGKTAPRPRTTQSTTLWEPPGLKYKLVREYKVYYVKRPYCYSTNDAFGNRVMVSGIRLEKRTAIVYRKVPVAPCFVTASRSGATWDASRMMRGVPQMRSSSVSAPCRHSRCSAWLNSAAVRRKACGERSAKFSRPEASVSPPNVT
ncbi:MAG: hypothetical protein N2C14_02345 [Planctomycetales bacterium]